MPNLPCCDSFAVRALSRLICKASWCGYIIARNSYCLMLGSYHVLIVRIFQAKNGGSESTSTEDDAQQPRRTRRMAARASASKAAARRSVRQRKVPTSRDEMSIPAASERLGVSEGGSFLAMIANAAVSVDGLRRVRPS